jgi:hypothetical protein
MNELDPDPTDKPDLWLRLEALVLGASLLIAYAMSVYFLFR